MKQLFRATVGICALACTLLPGAAGLAAPPPAAPQSATQSAPFTDVPASYPEYDAITLLAKYHILSGYPDGHFGPDEQLSRAAAAVIATRISGLAPSAASSSSFADLPATNWATPYVAAAARAGLVSGFGDKTFRPDQPLTRAQLASLVARTAHLPSSAAPVTVADIKPTDWYYKQVTQVLAAGLMDTAYGYFQPQAAATRADAAHAFAILYAANLPGPSVTLTQPGDAPITQAASATVTGTITAPAGVRSVQVNGMPVTLAADGSFSVPVGLTPGSNTLTVVATDSRGQSASATRTLYQLVPQALNLSGLTDSQTPVPGSDGTLGPSQSAYTISRYVSNPDPVRFYSVGCFAARQASLVGPNDGLTILDFGQPQTWDNGTTYGTYDFGSHYDSLATITAVSEAWLQGFWECSPPDGPTAKLSIGTSNFQGSTNRAHGKAWAQMINSINGWIAAQGYDRRLTAWGGNDMEPGWNTPTNTRAWVDGYNAVGRYTLIDYGDDAGGLKPSNGWTPADIWYVAAGAPLNKPMPEIYYTPLATLDWQPLSLWAYLHKGQAIPFAGLMTEHGMDNRTLTPAQGASALLQALNSDRRTAQQALPYLTDLTWGN